MILKYKANARGRQERNFCRIMDNYTTVEALYELASMKTIKKNPPLSYREGNVELRHVIIAYALST